MERNRILDENLIDLSSVIVSILLEHKLLMPTIVAYCWMEDNIFMGKLSKNKV